MSDDELKAFLAAGRPGEQLLAAEIAALRAKLADAEAALRAARENIANRYGYGSVNRLDAGLLAQIDAALRELEER